MRTGLGVVLLGLTACAAGPIAPAPTVARALAPTPVEASSSPPDLALPPANTVGPLLIIGGDRISIDGTTVGSARQIDEGGRPQKIDELFEILKINAAAWKTAHPGEVFPGVASLVVAPETSGLVFACVYQTTAFAGFPRIRVAVSGEYRPTLAQIPAPPCGEPEDPCPTGPPQYALHAQADGDGWRFRVPREEGPLDARGDGPRSSAEAFRAAAASAISTTNVGAIVLHVAPFVPFSRLAPFLVEAADLSTTAHLTRALTLSIRDLSAMFEGNGVARPEPISATGFGGRVETTLRPITPEPVSPNASASSRSGHSPAAIQKLVRSRFGAFRVCYERELRLDPTARGKVATRFTISHDGTPSEIRATLSGNLRNDVIPCVEAVFRTFVFEPVVGGTITVTYPIMFAPGE